MEKKLATSVEALCKGFPSEFVTYLSYCRNLRFDEKPDYAYLKNLFKDLFVKSGFEYDNMYDWVQMAKDKEGAAGSSQPAAGGMVEEKKGPGVGGIDPVMSNSVAVNTSLMKKDEVVAAEENKNNDKVFIEGKKGINKKGLKGN
jgi:hypothetical protein